MRYFASVLAAVVFALSVLVLPFYSTGLSGTYRATSVTRDGETYDLSERTSRIDGRLHFSFESHSISISDGGDTRFVGFQVTDGALRVTSERRLSDGDSNGMVILKCCDDRAASDADRALLQTVRARPKIVSTGDTITLIAEFGDIEMEKVPDS